LILEGKIWKFGRDIDTDVIIPAKYLSSYDPKELGKHCLESLDPDFSSKVSTGDILVAEENFGCGSSREHAPLAIKGAGISGVVAKSFARIFFRNAINIGLPIFECPPAVEEAKPGDVMRVDIKSGRITNVSLGREFRAEPYPQFIQEIIAVGGLIKYAEKKIRKKI